jgi:hypothetical protein
VNHIPKKELYCQFLIAAQTNYTATDFATHIDTVAHDAITRFLARTKLTPMTLCPPKPAPGRIGSAWAAR